MNDLILHHYDFSNFAEKARLMLGFKGVPWRGGEQPPILPKPNLAPLTRGYHRLPALPDRADVCSHTRLVRPEHQRRRAQPPRLAPQARPAPRAGRPRPAVKTASRVCARTDRAEALAGARAEEKAMTPGSKPEDCARLPAERGRVRAIENSEAWVEGEVGFSRAHVVA